MSLDFGKISTAFRGWASWKWAAVKPERTGHSIKWSLKSGLALLIMASASPVDAQTVQTICSLSGTNGQDPSTLTLGSDGNFYGTTWFGGSNIYNGTVFKVTTNGALTTLVSFNKTNGANPNALTLGSDGNFYGTTWNGGTNGYGTVFKVTTNGTLTTLYSFTGESYMQFPCGAGLLTLGSDGNFYGTTQYGGSSLNGNGDGMVFKVTTNGALTTLVSFNATNGAIPELPDVGQ